MQPKVSVIIPVYNAEKHLKECIDSIIRQEYANIELILVDDGSTDKSLSICKEYENADSRVRVLVQQNSGVSDARNNGIRVATGDYLAFVDSDDIVLPHIYSSMMKCGKKGFDLTMCNFVKFNENGYYEVVDQLSDFGCDQVSSGDLLERIMSCSPKAIFGSVWRLLIKTELLTKEKIRFTSGLTMAEDMQFLLKCISKISTIGICVEPLYKFRVSIESTTGKYMTKQDEDMKYVNDWMTEFVSENKLPQGVMDGVRICKANTLVLNIANTCKQNTPFSFWERVSYAKNIMKNQICSLA